MNDELPNMYHKLSTVTGYMWFVRQLSAKVHLVTKTKKNQYQFSIVAGNPVKPRGQRKNNS